ETTYWYRLKAIDDSSNVSWFSNRDSAKTLASGSPPDTGFYKFDAEDGLANLVINGDSIVVSTEQKYAGSYSYKVKGHSGTTRVFMEIQNWSVAPDTVWLTYRVYIPSGTNTDQGWMYLSNFGDGGDYFTFASSGLQGSGGNVTGWQFPFGTEVSTNWSTNTWHKIEVMYLKGTGANAVTIAYVDEDQVYTSSSGDATDDPDQVRLGAINWTMPVGDAIYYDDIILSERRLPLD
ncbi:MAG: hypothetical protein LC136_11755, partial [Burkholderiales bacterium]|nr:hypothetical protein [Burkholderiales bacterium]